MPETLVFKDNTALNIEALFLEKTFYKGSTRNGIRAKLLPASNPQTLTELDALISDSSKTQAITHNYTNNGAAVTTPYSNYIYSGGVSKEWDEGSQSFLYFINLCQKTETEAENETMKAQLAANLEG